MNIDLYIMTIIILGCLILIIARQQQTIDRLTDKIVGIQPPAKKNEIKEDDVSPYREDEPKSWHDKP